MFNASINQSNNFIAIYIRVGEGEFYPKLAHPKKLPIFNLLFVLDNLHKKKKFNANFFLF